MIGKPRFVRIRLEGEIVEDRSGGSFFSSKTRTPLRDLIGALQGAARDKRVRRVLLLVKSPSMGWNQVEELHCEMDRIHAAGKEVWTFLEQGSNLSYYLASASTRILMPPVSHLDLVGLRLELLYFRDLLERLGVKPQLFNWGRFKSAAEIFTRQGMSESHREALNSILEDYQRRLRDRVARKTGQSVEDVQRIIDGGPYSSSGAKAVGLIDELLYEDELPRRLEEDCPRIRRLPASKLVPRDGWLIRLVTRWRPRVAYILAEGLIVEGRARRGAGGRPTIGSDSLRELLERARENRRVKAVLLRIDSSGGSAIASDLLWREVRRTGREKPVIASMGATAASGGYFIASAAGKVYAMPSTLTGSIGVIGGKFSAAELLGKLRIGVDSVSKGAHAGYGSVFSHFSEGEVQIVEKHIEETYEAFLERVAEGRGLTNEAIRQVAEGRVWTGAQALERNLVDDLGGIDAALEGARQAAGIPPKRKIRLVTLAARRRLRDYFSLPLVESFSSGRLWAILPMILRIR